MGYIFFTIHLIPVYFWFRAGKAPLKWQYSESRDVFQKL